MTSLDLGAGGVGPRSHVIVATQGHYDEAALEAALATDATYVGLVASRRRAEAVLGYLHQRGVPEDALARVRAPAGLDLGPIAHQEIAVAVLAQIVALRASGELAVATATAPPPEVAIDPVCGMSVDMASARHRSSREGRTQYFCSAGCRASFEAQPSPPPRAASRAFLAHSAGECQGCAGGLRYNHLADSF